MFDALFIAHCSSRRSFYLPFISIVLRKKNYRKGEGVFSSSSLIPPTWSLLPIPQLLQRRLTPVLNINCRFMLVPIVKSRKTELPNYNDSETGTNRFIR